MGYSREKASKLFPLSDVISTIPNKNEFRNQYCSSFFYNVLLIPAPDASAVLELPSGSDKSLPPLFTTLPYMQTKKKWTNVMSRHKEALAVLREKSSRKDQGRMKAMVKETRQRTTYENGLHCDVRSLWSLQPGFEMWHYRHKTLVTMVYLVFRRYNTHCT
jgi:hypothetical protein